MPPNIEATEPTNVRNLSSAMFFSPYFLNVFRTNIPKTNGIFKLKILHIDKVLVVYTKKNCLDWMQSLRSIFLGGVTDYIVSIRVIYFL